MRESRQLRTGAEGGQSFTEIALAMAAIVSVLALAIFVVVPAVRPGESTSQRDAYIRAVATQQARADVERAATQDAEASGGGVADAALAPAPDANTAPAAVATSGGSDLREEIMFVALFGVALLVMVGGSWLALTRHE